MMPIFPSWTADFLKLYFVPLLMLMVGVFFSHLNLTWLFFAAIVVHSGHWYSTLMEVYLDPQERKKNYVWQITVASFLVTLFLVSAPASLIMLYFYLNYFHNIRQGMGITMLYRLKQKSGAAFYKRSYYFLTITPIILGHFRGLEKTAENKVILDRFLDIRPYINLNLYNTIWHYGLIFYCLAMVSIVLFILYRKYYDGLISLIFNCILFSYVFLINDKITYSYILLTATHAIQYFFIFGRRISLTHHYSFVKRSTVPLVAVFIVTGLMQFYGDKAVESLEDVNIFVKAVLGFPALAHIAFDSFIWNGKNEKFKTLKSDIKMRFNSES